MAHCIAPLCDKDHAHEVEGKPLCQTHYDAVMLMEAEVDKFCKIPLEDLVDDAGKEVVTLTASQNLHKRVIARRAELKAFVEAGKHTEAKAKKAAEKGKKKMGKSDVAAAVGGDDVPQTVVQRGVAAAKHYGKTGSIRIVASQLVKQSRPLIVNLLTAQFGKKDKTFATKLIAMLETPFGQAIHGWILSFILGFIPQNVKDRVPQLDLIVEELRVAGVAVAGDAIADMIVGPLMQLAQMYLANEDGVREQTDAVIESLGSAPAPANEVVIENAVKAPLAAAA